MKVALWGGIDYGMADSENENVVKTRAVLRGDNLIYLPGSLSEVDNISRMLKGKVGSVTPHTGNSATESSLSVKLLALILYMFRLMVSSMKTRNTNIVVQCIIQDCFCKCKCSLEG